MCAIFDCLVPVAELFLRKGERDRARLSCRDEDLLKSFQFHEGSHQFAGDLVGVELRHFAGIPVSRVRDGTRQGVNG